MKSTIDYERLYRDVSPAVVSIYPGRDDRLRGSGSGFVTAVGDIDPPPGSGYVVTNEHVVRGARGVDGVDIRFSDGQWRPGEVVGVDVYTDLAVVLVDDLPGGVEPLRVSERVPAPGAPVAALGNPLGLDGSITAGIVSGTNRSLRVEGGFSIPDVVQTDAPINPGNSGGPLVTAGADGGYEVVGVNRAKQGDNIGFAVSPVIVSRVVPTLVSKGRFRHAALRVRTVDVTPVVAEANGLDRPRGILVVDAPGEPGGDGLHGSLFTSVARGSRVPVGGDVLVGIDDRPLASHEELVRYLITETAPGDAVTLTVVRGGRERRVRVVLGERPRPGPDLTVP